jgi:hypothetical protein
MADEAAPTGDPEELKAKAASELPAASDDDDEPIPVKVVKAKSDDKGAAVLAKFLRVSGYEESDLLDYDTRRRTFVTNNGGKYHLLKSGVLRTTGGPQYPNYEAPSGE